MKLKVKRLHPDAKLPTRAHIGDLFDVYALEDTYIRNNPTLVRTGICFDIPEGYQIRIYNRSSNPIKHGLILSNSVGVIDTGFKDEIKGIFHVIPSKIVKTMNLNDENKIIKDNLFGEHLIRKGDKIMQFELVKINEVELVEVSELDKSNDRGGGFGSTDSKEKTYPWELHMDGKIEITNDI